MVHVWYVSMVSVWYLWYLHIWPVSVSVLGQYQHILMVLESVKYIIQVPIAGNLISLFLFSYKHVRRDTFSISVIKLFNRGKKLF